MGVRLLIEIVKALAGPEEDGIADLEAATAQFKRHRFWSLSLQLD